jgi:serine/threonine protein phosphatase 1
MPARTIAIGDIHGCFQALATLLEAIHPAADDRLIVLGDFVDRGPDSRAVIERLLDLQHHCQLVTLLGNHELMLLRALDDADQRRFWLCFGGQETLASYGGQIDAIPPAHLDFIRNARLFYETETHLFFHANYHSELPPQQQPEMLLIWTHLDRHVPAPHVSGKTVVVGHTPQLDGQVLDLGHLICLDTFCCGGGWLTALDVHAGTLWQASLQGRSPG